MRLAAADVAALPLAVALVDHDGALLASSPEWCGSGLGAVRYRLPTASLIVATEQQDAVIADVLRELVDALTSAADASHAGKRRRLDALATSVALVAGLPRLREGTTLDVVDNLSALLAAVSTTPVTVIQRNTGTVADASLAALALRQLVVNARRHDDAMQVTLTIDAGPTFTLEWKGRPIAESVSTSRHQADRDRWGLGFVRQAMDALGGVYLAPRAAAGATQLRAVLAIDRSPRLQLPLAALRDGVVTRASPAWDEETHATPGSAVPERWIKVTEASAQAPGTIAKDGSRRARTVARTTWMAIPAEGTTDRARDVIRGLDHERDLLDAPEPFATAIHGLAEVLALLLGDKPRRVTPAAFNAEYPRMAAELQAPSLPRAFSGDAAPEPALVAFLAARFATGVHLANGRLHMHLDQARHTNSLANRLAGTDGLLTLP